MSDNTLAEPASNDWGGDWTEKKLDIVVNYAKAYLTVMKDRKYWKLLYFDGFAGGVIEENGSSETYFSAAIRILKIELSRSFDTYYFVELNPTNADRLEEYTKQHFKGKDIYVVKEDCNKKLVALASYLKSPKGKNVKVLAFIDPYGMEVRWDSLQALKGLDVDLWILIPTGMGINRLLKINGEISEVWLQKLTTFLGMNESDIRNLFYKTKTIYNLFGEETHIQKEKNTTEKAATLYKNRLNELFKYVSNPYSLKNSTGSIMFHFCMATNNPTAFKIANDIIKKR